ncbi:MAG TPA: hypothetical protein QF695_15800 [Arenicellales bacterium]|nr:hypothetical protein [Arenicellales bacterium]HJL54080.1 hypothetical protein [Arenicellales bacterium]
MKRERRSAAQWQELFSEFEGSGQKVTAFCAERGLNAQYFSKRCRQFKPSPFVRVHAQTMTSPVTIQIAHVTLRCTAETPPAWIADLVHRLQ